MAINKLLKCFSPKVFTVCALSFLLSGIGCGSGGREVAGLHPEIKTFLSSHSEFGKATGVEDMPDWFKGPRQRVQFDSGRNLLFYMKDGQVVTVWEDTPSSGRQVVWGNTD
jgi:hypothetical protein